MNRKDIKDLGIVIGKIESLIVDIKGLRKASEHRDEKLGTEVALINDRVSKLEKKQFTIIVITTAIFSTALAFIKKLF